MRKGSDVIWLLMPLVVDVATVRRRFATLSRIDPLLLRRVIGSEQALMVGITLWYLWKSRNEFLFAAKRESSKIVARIIPNWKLNVEIVMARDNRLHPGQGRRMEAQISWKSGPCDWVIVNVDGSVLRSPARAAAGGVVRSNDGRAMGAFIANLGVVL
ncbi:hypothetical protein LINPERHAP1_LOCUS17535 [Linum perenne]